MALLQCSLVMLSYHFHSVTCEVVAIRQMDLGKEATLPLGLNKQTNIHILTIQLYILHYYLSPASVPIRPHF